MKKMDRLRKEAELTMEKEYWYKFIVEECPVCGRGSKWKERIYDRPRPKKKEDRYKFDQSWCHCDL